MDPLDEARHTMALIVYLFIGMIGTCIGAVVIGRLLLG